MPAIDKAPDSGEQAGVPCATGPIERRREGSRVRACALIAVALAFLLLLFGFQVYRWGRPVPTTLARAGTNQWSVSGNGPLEARDRDGDGTWDLLLSGNREIPLPATPQCTLLVCLDGVPYAEMRALWDAGNFREFAAPVEVVSTFPSDSELAMTAMLHAATAPGYENRYYYRKKGKIVGGITVTLAQSAPYLKKLDYDEPGIFKGLHFILPVKSYRADIGRLRKRFRASSKPLYIAHISSTDGLYHVMPPGGIRPLLVEAGDVWRELFLRAGGKLRIVLFSDHGNDLTPAKAAPVKEAIEKAGFDWSSAIKGPRDVAVPEYGLVSFVAVYANDAAINELSGVLARTEGVEAVVYRAGGAGKVFVRSADGLATVESDLSLSRFRYEPSEGDPLELLPVIGKLREQGKVDPAGWVNEQDMVQATLGTRYPDAPFRIMEWANEERSYVTNRADIMVSLKPGYFSGSGVFQRLVTLQSTHGALNRKSSLGFAMSTGRELAGPQRYDQVLNAYLK